MASVLSHIEADIKTFFHDLSTSAGKFAAEFEKLFRKVPSALQMIENYTQEIAPVIVGAVDLADPVAEPDVAAALATVETAIAGLEAAAQAADSGQSVVEGLKNLQAEVPTLLGSLKIENPALQATITKIVNLIVGEAAVLIPAAEAWVKQIDGANTGTPGAGVAAL